MVLFHSLQESMVKKYGIKFYENYHNYICHKGMSIKQGSNILMLLLLLWLLTHILVNRPKTDWNTFFFLIKIYKKMDFFY